MVACSGSCLSWNQRDEWHVTLSWVPADGVFHRHRLLGLKGERPLFWLFEANDGFVARLQDMKLQCLAATPKLAIESLRQCLRRHRAIYGGPVVNAQARQTDAPVTHSIDDTAFHGRYLSLVRAAQKKSKFWDNNRELLMAARLMLDKIECDREKS